MNNLEIYFQGEYKTDAGELNELDEVIKNVLPTFEYAIKKDGESWPYKIKSVEKDQRVKSVNHDTSEKEAKDASYSTSTNSMILSMMGVAENAADREHLFPRIASESIFSAIGLKEIERWTTIREAATKKYISVIKSSVKDDILMYSDTYGINDPLSLLWCLGILKREESKEAVSEEILDELKNKIVEIVSKKAETIHTAKILDFTTIKFLPTHPVNCEDGDLRIPSKFKKEIELKSPELNKHSFISLRLLQLIGMVDELRAPEDKIFFKSTAPNKVVADHAFSFFERRLHLYLSYSNIPDSRFDPAELVFSLEGALRTKGNDAISNETIERTFQVLEKVQDFTPYWRPVNPIYATSQGQILLPLSVEVANSLLRICALLNDERHGRECLFSKHSGMFKRYFRWLKAQIKKITYGDKTCWGWTSEHVGGDDEIHLFQTSEIACFLMNYRHMLQERIAQRSLAASGLKVDYPQRQDSDSSLSISEYWDKRIEPEYEPLSELPAESKYRIYKKIGDDFVKPKDGREVADGIADHYSMLLYGPPGTGKSTVGKNVAKALNWKYITVTPSDFLAGGAAEVEARAKFIFKCLEEQKCSVILFDEIDHFLLDRESEEYKTQTGIFQFMTPGMLPKINDLRERKRCIFIIATNYEERIDSAIKRKGRIDYRAPLMPPAYSLRSEIIKKVKRKNPEYDKKAVSTAGFTFIDITGLAEEPSLTLEQYHNRFIEEGAEGQNKLKEFKKSPLVEFCLLRMIYAQDCSEKDYSLGKKRDEKAFKKTKSFFENCLEEKDCKKLLSEFDSFMEKVGNDA